MANIVTSEPIVPESFEIRPVVKDDTFKAVNLRGRKKIDPLRKYRFHLYVEGLGATGFNKISGLAVDFGKTTYSEGGRNLTPRVFLGKVTFPDITLSKGLMPDGDLGNEALSSWAFQRMDTETMVAPYLGALSQVSMKRMCLLQAMNEKGEVEREYVIYDAWVKQYVVGTWDSMSKGIIIEKLILAHNGWQDTATSWLATGVAKVMNKVNEIF